MHSLKDADYIFKEMMEENPHFAKELIMQFRTEMPEEYIKSMFEARYGKHIIDKSYYEQGLKFIKDKDGNPITPWTIEEVEKISRDYINNIDDEEFFIYDLAMQANIYKADFSSVISDASKIIRMAILSLKDTDNPFFEDASERAYCWVYKHLCREEEELEKELKK